MNEERWNSETDKAHDRMTLWWSNMPHCHYTNRCYQRYVYQCNSWLIVVRGNVKIWKGRLWRCLQLSSCCCGGRQHAPYVLCTGCSCDRPQWVLPTSVVRGAKRGCLLIRYTVRLLSFRTGITKSICVKEMTLLLFSFRHTSLLTVHTDLHGHTASGCLCRSRPLQWCLMHLSQLSGCPKSSQRDAPSSKISLFGTKGNQHVLNLANTERGRAQSLFVVPKTAWRLSRCGTGRRAKGTVTRFTHARSDTSNSA